MIRLLLHRLRPQASPQKIERNPELEGMRGVCALLVFIAHLFLPFPVLDPVWTPSDLSFGFNLGYPAVLMFFVLSGYVIGLSTNRPANSAEVRTYLFHRAARLIPLNTIAVLICWLLLARTEVTTVLGNLLFLQNNDPYPILGTIPVMANNPNLWSLNYEAVYYLVFVLVWWWAPPTSALFTGLTLLVCADAFGLPIPRSLSRYACGGFYWFAGLTVAWTSAIPSTSTRRNNWPAAALIAYAIWMFAPLRVICMNWGLYEWVWPAPTPVSPHRLDFLPACLWLLLTITNRSPNWQRLLSGICLSLALAGVAAHVLSADWQQLDTFGLIALLLGIILFRRSFSLDVLGWLAPLGGISFALYLIAAPLQLGQRAIATSFSGSIFTFFARLVGAIAVVFASAWVLERRLCPPLSRLIKHFGKSKG